MPLTAKGKKVLQSMQGQYGAKKGEQVFYASKNAGKIKGVDRSSTADAQARKWQHLADRAMKRMVPKPARDYKPTFDALVSKAQQHFHDNAPPPPFKQVFRDALRKGISVRDAMKQALDMCPRRK